MAMAGTIRLAPTVIEMGTMDTIWTIGMPILSISLTIVAPQRAQVPHVETRRTASTLFSNRSFAMASPKPFAFLTAVPLPTVA